MLMTIISQYMVELVFVCGGGGNSTMFQLRALQAKFVFEPFRRNKLRDETRYAYEKKKKRKRKIPTQINARG